MKLSAIKKQLATIKPFVSFDFRGIGDCLVLENTPLSLGISPPSITFILESEQITQLILRYSETYKKSADKSKTKHLSEVAKAQLANKAISDMQKKILGDDAEMLKMVKTMSQLGKEYLRSRTVSGWYGDATDNFDVEYFDKKEEADRANVESDDTKLAIWMESFTDEEVIKIAMELISVMPTDQVANVPILEEVVAEETGELEVTSKTVPADKLASFPRDLRRLVVEDSPRQGPDDIGDNKSVSQTGS